MDIQRFDVLNHKSTGVVYVVQKIEKFPHGGVKNIVLLNKQTNQLEKFDPKTLDNYFTKIDEEHKSDVSEMSNLGPADYESLKAVKREYQSYLASFGGDKPPKYDQQYTNPEIRSILEVDNLVHLYELAMQLQRTKQGLVEIRNRAKDAEHPEHWKSWAAKGTSGNPLAGDSTYWQVQTVVKDMGGHYNPLLDQRPDLEVRI